MVQVQGPHIETPRPRKCFSGFVCAPHISGGLCQHTHPGASAQAQNPNVQTIAGAGASDAPWAPGPRLRGMSCSTSGQEELFEHLEMLRRARTAWKSSKWGPSWFGLPAPGCARRDPDEVEVGWGPPRIFLPHQTPASWGFGV